MVKKQLRETEYTLTPKQIKKLISSTEDFRNRLIIKLLAYTGIKREELVSITCGDIQLEKLCIRIVGRGNIVRNVPISGDIKTDILKHLDKRKKGYLFPALLKKGVPLRKEQINKIIMLIGRKIGLENPNPRRRCINPGIFRHSFARNWLDSGLKINSLSKILGHQNILVTYAKYGSNNEDDIRKDYYQMMKYAGAL